MKKFILTTTAFAALSTAAFANNENLPWVPTAADLAVDSPAVETVVRTSNGRFTRTLHQINDAPDADTPTYLNARAMGYTLQTGFLTEVLINSESQEGLYASGPYGVRSISGTEYKTGGSSVVISDFESQADIARDANAFARILNGRLASASLGGLPSDFPTTPAGRYYVSVDQDAKTFTIFGDNSDYSVEDDNENDALEARVNALIAAARSSADPTDQPLDGYSATGIMDSDGDTFDAIVYVPNGDRDDDRTPIATVSTLANGGSLMGLGGDVTGDGVYNRRYTNHYIVVSNWREGELPTGGTGGSDSGSTEVEADDNRQNVKIDDWNINPPVTIEYDPDTGALSDLTYHRSHGDNDEFVIPGNDNWVVGLDTAALVDLIHVDAQRYIDRVYDTSEINYNVGEGRIRQAVNAAIRSHLDANIEIAGEIMTREEFLAHVEIATPYHTDDLTDASKALIAEHSFDSFVDYVIGLQTDEAWLQERPNFSINGFHFRLAKTMKLLEAEAVVGACEIIDPDSKSKHVAANSTTAAYDSATIVDGEISFTSHEEVVESCGPVINPKWLDAARTLENKIADDIKNGQKLVGEFKNFVLVINTSSGGVEFKKEFVVAESGKDKLTITPRLGIGGFGQNYKYTSAGAEVAYETTEIRDLLLKLGYDTGTEFTFTQGTLNGFRGLRGNGNTGDYGFVYVEQGAADEIKVTVRADTQQDWDLGLKKGPYSASVNQDGQVTAKYTIKF